MTALVWYWKAAGEIERIDYLWMVINGLNAVIEQLP